MMEIRDHQRDDDEAIRGVLVRAFGGEAEADLVDALCNEGDAVLSLVAVNEAVVGHALFSRLRVQRSSGTESGLALAPLAVDPEFQRRGIGSALVRAGLERAREMGERIVFVLGDPAYYGRFGFSAELARGFECVYACEAFGAVLLDGDLPGGMTGTVVYPRPFAELGGEGQ